MSAESYEKILREPDPFPVLAKIAEDPRIQNLILRSSKHFGDKLIRAAANKKLERKHLVTLAGYLSRLGMRCTPLGITSSLTELSTNSGPTLLDAPSDDRRIRTIDYPDSPAKDLVVLSSRALIRESKIYYSKYEPEELQFAELARDLDPENMALLRYFEEPRDRKGFLRSFTEAGPAVLVRMKKLLNFWIQEGALLEINESQPSEVISSDPEWKEEGFEEFLNADRPTDTYNTLLVRPFSGFRLGEKELHNVQKAAEIIREVLTERNLWNRHNRWLRDFRRKFVERFGEAPVPLELALHPTLGVPWGLNPEDRPRFSTDNYLAKKRLAVSKVWDISDKELEELRQLNGRPAETESETVYGSFLKSGDKILFAFKNVVSGHPLATVSRFNLFSVAGAPKVVTKSEDTIFAEVIARSSRERTLLRRRKLQSRYVITVDIEGPKDHEVIPFRELELSWRDDRIHLYSKRLEKFIVPVITHVQQFILDSNRVMQFLGAIAYQESPLLTGWHWGDATNLQHFPRVTYKNIILCPETWYIDRKIVCEKILDPEFRKDRKIPDRVIMVEEGKELFLNLNQTELCREHFRKFKEEEITLYETFGEYESAVTIAGERFQNEVQITFTNPLPAKSEEYPFRPLRILNPGDDFLGIVIKVPEALRFEVATQFLPDTNGFYIFHGLQDQVTELRIRLLGSGLLARIPGYVVKLVALKAASKISGYTFGTYETDDHLFRDPVPGNLLLRFHAWHTERVLANGANVVPKLLFSDSLAIATAVASILGVKPKGRTVRGTKARRIEKALLQGVHLKKLPQVSLPPDLAQGLLQIRAEDRKTFLNRLVHLNNLRIDPDGNYEFDSMIFNLIR